MTIEEKQFVQQLYDAAIEAVEHVAQANWSGREQAAKMWLYQIFCNNTSKSLDQIQEEINQNDAEYEEKVDEWENW